MNTEYAMKGGNLVHVSAVERGLKCECVCPGCGEKMIARKGTKMAHHFAHQGAECSHGLETTLHFMAKEILEQEKKILLPSVKLSSYNGNMLLVSEPTLLEFDKVLLEESLGDIVPDVVIKKGDKRLLVEIWVTHKIDDNKREKIEKRGVSTLEINLSKLDRTISKEELRKVILEDTDRKRWIYNSRAEYYEQKLLSICEVKEVTERGFALHVDYCPKRARDYYGKPYANVMNDCSGCEYFMVMTHDLYYENKRVYCSGKAKVKTISDLKTYLKKKAAV